MGKKWIYRHKKEDFAHVAQRPNVALEGRLSDMRKALSEYYSETENDPAPAGGPSALDILTTVLGAEAPVAEAFAPGFLPPDIPSSGCGPFRTVLVRMLEPGSAFP